jgi:hypothetical protein
MCQPGLAMFHSNKNINNGANLSSMSGFMYNKTFNTIFPRKAIVLGIIRHILMAFTQLKYQVIGCTFVLEMLEYMNKEILKTRSTKLYFPEHMKNQEQALRDEMTQMIIDGTAWIKQQICMHSSYFQNRKFKFLCPFLDVGIKHSENGFDEHENKCLKIINATETVKFCAEALYCTSNMDDVTYQKTMLKYRQWVLP